MPGQLHHAAVGSEVAAQDREAAVRLERCVGRANHVLALGLLGGVRDVADRLAGHGRGVAVEQAGLVEPTDHERDAAGAVEVGRHVAAAGLEVAEQWGLPGDAVEVLDVELDARLVGDREQVQDEVGGAARHRPCGDRVLERLAGDDVGRRAALLEHLEHEPAAVLRDLALPAVLGGHHRASHRRDPKHLERHRHRVGGELAAAGAGAGARVVLEVEQVVVAEVTGGMGADALEDVLDRHVLAAPAPGRDRAAVEHQARHVAQPGERHHAAGDRLVAARQRDQGVEHVAARHELDRVGDHLAAHERGAHALGAHRDAVRDGDGVELHRRAAGGAHAVLDPLGEPAQVEVAGHRLGPGVGDADDRPLQRVVVEADSLQVRARLGSVRAVEDDPAAPAEVSAHRLFC